MKTIKDMPAQSRPREKLQEKGASALTDEELVAAIIGMGTAVRDLLAEAGNILGLRVQDHIIVSKKGHFSFQDAGLIKG